MSPDHPRRRTAPALLAARIWVWRSRHVLRVLAVGLAVLPVVRVLAPPPPATTPVVVTAGPVAAGEELTRADLRLVRLSGPVPRGATADLAPLVGRSPLVDLPADLPLVDPLLEGARFALEPPAGSVVVPLNLPGGALTAVLRPGDRVDIVTTATDDGGGEQTLVLAHRALVVDVREVAGPDAGTPLVPAPDAGAPAVSVAVSPEEGRELAAATGWSTLGAVLVP